MNGLKKSTKQLEDNGMPSLPTIPTQVIKTGNVASVDVFRVAHLFTFGPRAESVVNGLKKSGKKGEAPLCAHRSL